MSNGGMGNGIMDPTGTIDPSALNSAGKTASARLLASAIALPVVGLHKPSGSWARPVTVTGVRIRYIRSSLPSTSSIC